MFQKKYRNCLNPKKPNFQNYQKYSILALTFLVESHGFLVKVEQFVLRKEVHQCVNSTIIQKSWRVLSFSASERSRLYPKTPSFPHTTHQRDEDFTGMLFGLRNFPCWNNKGKYYSVSTKLVKLKKYTSPGWNQYHRDKIELSI